MKFAVTRKLIPYEKGGIFVDNILGKPNALGTSKVLSVKAYPSEMKGVAYYSLSDTSRIENVLENTAHRAVDGLDNLLKGYEADRLLAIPLPGPKIPFPK